MRGGLNKRYGIKELIDGFNMIENNELELRLYGDGDLVDYIKEKEKENKKIKYMGFKSNDEIIKAEKKAILLVNPRPSNEEYTKYSFPSKTIEYMLTGTPVLMTKLQGMPKEYNDYLYFIEDESSEGIKNTINKLLSKTSTNELIQKGEKAKEFIVNRKNNLVQGDRIIKLMKNILEENNEA